MSDSNNYFQEGDPSVWIEEIDSNYVGMHCDGACGSGGHKIGT